MARKRLSVFYITRNNGDTISKSISSVKNIANEIIVVDLGSIDDTISICRKFGCSVYKYKWDGDESSAKNFALSKCGKEYIMCMESDEILEQGSVGKIKAILHGRSISRSGYYFNIKYTFNDWIANDPNIVSNSSKPQVRLFPKDVKIKYSGKKDSSIDHSIMNYSNISIKSSSCSLIKWIRTKKEKNVLQKEKNVLQKENINKKENIVSKEVKLDKDVGQCAIVLVVYNAFSFAKDCFDSIQNFTNSKYKIYLVNNGSTDENVHDYFSGIENICYIKNKKNEGVAKGRNIGINEAMKDKNNKFICLIDSDTKVTDNWLLPMLSFLIKNKKCAMVGPITNACTGHQNIVRNSWVSKYDKDTIINMAGTNGNFSETSYLDRFCQVFRRDLITNVGMLDESFGIIGWEELDFCKRIVQSGMDMYISGASYVYHAWHASTRFNGMNYNFIVKKASKNYHSKWNKKIIKEKEVEEKIVPNSTPDTSVIVLTYNNLEMNKRFFKEFEKYTNNYELIVVDNGSTDGTVEFLNSLECIDKIVKNSTNQGVIKARNVGLRLSTKPYMICLDNDQIVKKDWLTHLHREMLKGYDLVGVEAWEMSEKHLMPKKRHVLKRGRIKIDYVGAGGCLMKRSVLEDIGIFDERFGMAYYEDPDLCFRAKEAGYKIGWCHRNIINHLEHQTLIQGQNDFNYNEQLASSHRLFCEKVNNKKNGKVYEECRLDDDCNGDIVVEKYLKPFLPMEDLSNGDSFKLGVAIPYRGRFDMLKGLFMNIKNAKGRFKNDSVVFCLANLGDEDGRLEGLCEEYGIEYLYIDDKGVFSIGECMNRVAQNINCEYLFVNDVDCYPSFDFYHKLLAEVDFLKSECNPYAFSVCGVYYANSSFSDKYLNKKVNGNTLRLIDKDESHREMPNFCGTMPLFNRKTFLNIGGIYRGFRGHGAEDFLLVHQLNSEYKKYSTDKDYPGEGFKATGIRDMVSFYNLKTYNKNIFLIHKFHRRDNDAKYVQSKANNWSLMYDLIKKWDSRIVLFENHPFLTDKNILNHFGGVKRICKSRNKSDFEDLIKSNNISCFVHVNPYLHNNSELIEIAKKYNIPRYCVERGALENTMHIDPDGFNVLSSSYDKRYWDIELSDEDSRNVEDYIEKYILGSNSLEKQPKRRCIDKTDGKKVLFVPLQVPTDTVIRFHSGWVKNMNNLVNICEKIATDFKDWKVVVKPHPLDKTNYKFKKCIKINNHMKDILDYCDCVMTINSGVGLQAMMWGKPTIVLGEAFYQFDDINTKVNSVNDIYDNLNNLKYPDMNMVKRFIFYLKFRFYSDVAFIRTKRDFEIGATSTTVYKKIRIIE